MKFVPGLVVGTLVGSAIAVAVAPPKGVSLASGDDAIDLIHKGKALIKSARTRIDQAVAEGRQAADAHRQVLQSLVS